MLLSFPAAPQASYRKSPFDTLTDPVLFKRIVACPFDKNGSQTMIKQRINTFVITLLVACFEFIVEFIFLFN
jgi:hypothetical protein